MFKSGKKFSDSLGGERVGRDFFQTFGGRSLAKCPWKVVIFRKSCIFLILVDSIIVVHNQAICPEKVGCFRTKLGRHITATSRL